jgi:hypothetical protein
MEAHAPSTRAARECGHMRNVPATRVRSIQGFISRTPRFSMLASRVQSVVNGHDVGMSAMSASKRSPLDVPSNPCKAVIQVTDVSIFVHPAKGNGARLTLRSEVVARSVVLQDAAASPCNTTRILTVPYDALSQWFIFVLAEMGEAATVQQWATSSPNVIHGKDVAVPMPASCHIDLCTEQELINVFMVCVFPSLP